MAEDPDPQDHVRRGAYGLRIELDGADDLLGPVPETWPAWELVTRPQATIDANTDADAVADDAKVTLSETEATKTIAGGGHMLIERQAQRTTFFLPARLPPGVLAHPLLSFTAVVAAHWQSHQAFHAGAFVVGGGAWGVIGEKGAGKSSMLAAIARLGYAVLSDDVTIIADGCCLAGPRAVDLRADAARQFAHSEPLGQIGARERWRVLLGEVEPEVPLRGWISLSWGQAGMAAVSAGERMSVLIENLGIRTAPTSLGTLLDLAGLQMLRFARPRSLDRLDATATTLIEAAGSLGGDPASRDQGPIDRG